MFFLLICCLLLTGCQSVTDPCIHDETLPLAHDAYERTLLAPPPPSPAPFVPKMAQAPQIPLAMKRRISIQADEELPVKQLLLQAAQQAGVNVVIDPTIVGSVYYHAKNERFIDVAHQICTLVGLRYQTLDQTIRFEPDTPYAQSYQIQFPNLLRENSNKISTATDVFAAGAEGQNREFGNGSSTLLSINGKADFWQELEDSIGTILRFENPQPEGSPCFAVNRQAGIINVFAPFQTQHKIQEYINDVLLNCQQQVLIEAKIVEVNLNKDYQSGINWHSIENVFKAASPLGRDVPTGEFDKQTFAQRNVISLGYTPQNLSVLAHFLNRFGTVRTLSSPRLTVLNNQAALLKVATNFVFFKIQYSRERGPQDAHHLGGDIERASSQIQTVPIGLVMSVQPTVDRHTGRVILSLRPTISRVVSEKEDPAVAILSQQKKQSMIPEVQVREMDSILQVLSGETVIMGGLMEERATNERHGLPYAQDLPFFGTLFGSRSDRRHITELVVLLRATLVDAPQIDLADQRVYNVFAKDPRPLRF